LGGKPLPLLRRKRRPCCQVLSLRSNSSSRRRRRGRRSHKREGGFGRGEQKLSVICSPPKDQASLDFTIISFLLRLLLFLPLIGNERAASHSSESPNMAVFGTAYHDV